MAELEWGVMWHTPNGTPLRENTKFESRDEAEAFVRQMDEDDTYIPAEYTGSHFNARLIVRDHRGIWIEVDQLEEA